MWMPNFSGSEEKFAFTSCLIKHGTFIDVMMIKTSLFPTSKKLEIEAGVKKLRALQIEDDQLVMFSAYFSMIGEYEFLMYLWFIC
ncbi:unnamed protein product [Eruca vesicaria subsp. sativa]|uniref:Uncharacterized protein n=1 Tax=Eruca vesicaria subsp. sativa TaxID=29727 RepID=A0ABC8IXM5_ERUVS|nr:unnamed protein product [Eruca vesicaria subsp. sativa]